MKCFTRWEVSASVPRQVGNKKKNTQETYLTSVSSAGEAETQIINELEKSCSGTFKITKIQVSKIDDVIFSDGDKWFKASIKYAGNDGKDIKLSVLVRSPDIDSASNE